MKKVEFQRRYIASFMGVLMAMKKHSGLEFQMMLRKNLKILSEQLVPIKEVLMENGVDNEDSFREIVSPDFKPSDEAGVKLLEFMSEKESLELHTIKFKDLPKDINGYSLDAIWPVVEEESE